MLLPPSLKILKKLKSCVRSCVELIWICINLYIKWNKIWFVVLRRLNIHGKRHLWVCVSGARWFWLYFHRFSLVYSYSSFPRVSFTFSCTMYLLTAHTHSLTYSHFVPAPFCHHSSARSIRSIYCKFVHTKHMKYAAAKCINAEK